LYANVPRTDTGKTEDLLVYKQGQRPAEVRMKARNRERYKELSEHAEVEDDPKKLRKITNEINCILKAEINRLKNGPNGPKP
jgi:hypothetical protein